MSALLSLHTLNNRLSSNVAVKSSISECCIKSTALFQCVCFGYSSFSEFAYFFSVSALSSCLLTSDIFLPLVCSHLDSSFLLAAVTRAIWVLLLLVCFWFDSLLMGSYYSFFFFFFYSVRHFISLSLHLFLLSQSFCLT